MPLLVHFWRTSLVILKIKTMTVLALYCVVQAVQAQDLLETYQEVEKSDPRLLIGSLNINIGTAREDQKFGQLLPQASLNSSATSTTRRAERFPIDHYSGQRYLLSVRQTLFDMKKLNAWQQAKFEQEQSIYEFEDIHSTVMLDTVERYFNLLKATDDLALIKEEKAVVIEKKEQISALFEKKLVKITELFEISARLDMLESDVVEASRLVEFAIADLSELTGKPIQKLSKLTSQHEAVESIGDINEYLELLKTRNASLNAWLKSIQANKKNVKQQKAEHYPVLDLQVSKQQTNIGFENSASAVTDTEVISLNLSIPIFSGGTTTARVYEAEQKLKISEASYDQEYRRIKKELKDTYLNVESTKQRIVALETAVKSAEKSYKSLEKSFKFGVSTIAEVLDAKQFQLQAKQRFQQARYDYIISKARFYFKAGLLTEEILGNINLRLETENILPIKKASQS